MTLVLCSGVRRSSWWIVCLVAALLLSGCASKGTSMLEQGPRAAPYTRLTLIDGRYVPLQEFAERPLVLMFWSTTCSASRSEIRRLDALAAKHGNRIHVVAVSLDRDLRSLEDAIRSFGLVHLTHAFSGNEAADEAYLAFQQRDIPQLFLVGTDGILYAHTQTVRALEERLDAVGVSER